VKTILGKNFGTRRRKWLTISGSILLIAALLWAFIPAYLQHRVSTLVGNTISQHAGVQASVASVEIDLLRQKLGLYGLRIPQPAGFGDGDLLYIPAFEASLCLRETKFRLLQIQNVRLKNAKLHLRTNDVGMLNVQEIGQRIGSAAEAAEVDPNARLGLWSEIVLKSIMVTNSAVIYQEPTRGSHTTSFRVADIAVDGSNIHIAQRVSAPPEPTGHLRATGKLQRNPFPDGRLGIDMRLGTLGDGFPPLQASLRIIGLELALIGTSLPENTASMLGGNAIDLAIDLQYEDDEIEGSVRIDTIAGYRHEATLSGIPSDPVVATDSDALSYVLARTRGTLAAVGRNVWLAGEQVVRDGVGIAIDLAETTAHAVGSFGGGLWQSLKGIVTFSGNKISRGAKQMGTALTGGAKDAVFGAGGEVIEGVGAITDNLTGDATASAWREDIPTRWTNTWQDVIGRESD